MDQRHDLHVEPNPVTNQEMAPPVHPDVPRVDTPEHLAEDLQRDTPDGRRPPERLMRREKWIPFIVLSLLLALAVGAIWIAAGFTAFLVALIIAALVWTLAGAPVWRSAWLRHREHEEIEHTVDEVFPEAARRDRTTDTRQAHAR